MESVGLVSMGEQQLRKPSTVEEMKLFAQQFRKPVAARDKKLKSVGPQRTRVPYSGLLALVAGIALTNAGEELVPPVVRVPSHLQLAMHLPLIYAQRMRTQVSNLTSN